MLICLLTTQNLDADPFPANDWPCDPRPFLPEATWHLATLEDKETSVAQVTRLVARGFDLFFNLCDGAADQDVPGIEVIQPLEALNVPVSQRVRQIELNMERWRWLPRSLGSNYLLVNIADFRANVIEEGKTVLSMPVVVGNAYRKTPVFSAELEYVEFAPYWLVPPTILEEDKLPVIRSDPGYLERNHYEIVSWDQQQDIDPQSIDWSTVDSENFPGVLRQRPGPWNPLGRVKFIFPNDYAIYLHDTNRRDLFRQRNRKYSSGCIRLQRPDKLANYLLCNSGWNEKLVDKAMRSSVSQQVYLEQPLPVHVLYWTAWIDDDGLVNFREDVYNRDQDLQQALDQRDAGCLIHRPNLARR